MFSALLSAYSGLRLGSGLNQWVRASFFLASLLASLEYLILLPLCAEGGGLRLGGPDELFSVCREAWLSSQKGLQGGEGNGKFERVIDGKVVLQADVAVSFTADKYRVEMDYTRPGTSGVKKSTLIYGDECILVVEHTESQKKERREGHCYNTVRGSNIPPVMAGFAFSPIKPIQMINPATMKRDRVVEAKEEPNGNLVFRYRNQDKGVFIQFVASKEHSYNIVSCNSYRFSFDEPPVQSERITWDRQSDVWYIKEIEKTLTTYASGKPHQKILNRLAYSSFRVNPPIQKDRFTLDSAGLFEGSRILDHRPNVSQREYYYYTDKAKKSDSIKNSWQDLPTKPLPKKTGSLSVSAWFIGLNAAAVALLLTGAGLLVWRRKNGKT